MIIKYSEVFLSIKFRIKYGKASHGYGGGPMYYLKKAFNSPLLAYVSCVLLIIYSCEIYQFSVAVESISYSYGFDRRVTAIVCLSVIMLCAIGGIGRVANICIIFMPGFMLIYVLICLYIMWDNSALLLPVLGDIFSCAFTGRAETAGIAGGAFLAAMHYGAQRAVYSGDIGIGYDAVYTE